MNKFLNKVASLLKGKRFVGKLTNTSGFRFKGQGKDLPSFDKLESLHNTVLHQQQAGSPSVKHRLEFSDGSKAFIRGTSKGVRSRLYKE